MFDHHHHVHESRPATVHVTEQRAPTDQSVRLLKEMEAEARAKVSASIRVADTHFECVLHTMEDFLNDRINVAVIFSINSKRCRADVILERWENKDSRIAKIIDAVASQVAVQLLQGTLSKALAEQIFS